MSRKGKQPIALPKGVVISVVDHVVQVKGVKGELHQAIPEGLEIKVEEGKVWVQPGPSLKGRNDLHGLYWSLVQNMVLGVHAGFEKKLELVGIGYRANVVGQFIELLIGRSHPTKIAIPAGITVKAEKNFLSIAGINKQVVGQLAASVRRKRPPEPYQGKGIRYVGEFVRKKAGKSASGKSK